MEEKRWLRIKGKVNNEKEKEEKGEKEHKSNTFSFPFGVNVCLIE